MSIIETYQTSSSLYNINGFSFAQKQEQIKESIRENTLCSTVVCKSEPNQKQLLDVQNIYNSLPSLLQPKKKKLEKPSIKKIEILKTDTQEIKNIIRKINRKTQTFRCDHNKIDKKFHSFESELAKIYSSPDIKIVNDFMSSLLHEINQIINKDNKDKTYQINIVPSQLKKAQDAVISINGKINELNSFFESLTCVKCEKIIAEYEYALEEVDELRQEQQELLATVAEDKYSIKTFMSQQFPSMNRIKLSDVCNKYKELYGLHKTQAEMTEALEETQSFRVSNVKNIKYVNRIT